MILVIRLFALALSMASFGLWYQDGARMGLWQTSVGTIVEIPIVEGMPELGVQEKIVWTEKFVSGVETPLGGLVVFLLLFILSQFLKRRLKKKGN